MNSQAEPIPAPPGSVAWTPSRGFVYERSEARAAVEAGETVLVVSQDGDLRGVSPSNRAPLRALLRVEADVAELVQRVGELGDRAAGLDTGLATDVTALKHRVRRLEDRASR